MHCLPSTATPFFFWDAVMFPQASCWAGLMPTAPTWRSRSAHLRGAANSWGIHALLIFKNTQCVITHKAVGLIVYLNFEKIMEDFDEQKVRKCNYVWFSLNLFQLHRCLTDCLLKSKLKLWKSTILIFQPNLLLNTKRLVVVFSFALHYNCYGTATRIAVGLRSWWGRHYKLSGIR